MEISIEQIVELFKKANEGADISCQQDNYCYIINCVSADGHFSLPEGFTLEGDNLNSDKYDLLFPLKFNLKSKASEESDEYFRRHTRRDFNSQLLEMDIPKEEKFKIIETRNEIRYEEQRAIQSAFYTGLWVLIGAASIYLNKEGIMTTIQNPQELLQSWPQFIDFLHQLGPFSLFSMLEVILHSRSYLKHIDKFNDLIIKLNSYSEVNMTQIPNNTILNNLRTYMEEFVNELREIGRRH